MKIADVNTKAQRSYHRRMIRDKNMSPKCRCGSFACELERIFFLISCLFSHSLAAFAAYKNPFITNKIAWPVAELQFDEQLY